MVVLYRKYRPQKIAEIDNLAVRQKLETLLSAGHAPHAFLFTGPKGTGKTSSARIIAKSANCEKNNGLGEPCNKCSTCLSITNGVNLDILEIDAASNRGIDEIRDLRDKIRLAPAGARKKVYIIDEVHMLTNEAFNALLKTLEEPPEHAIFVLCTTNSEKLPETIVSRCTRIDFRRANDDDLMTSLKRVKRGEKREIEEEALTEIANLAEGSFRDGHKLLEEVLITFPRAKITADLVRKTLGRGEFGKGDFLKWLLARDAQKALLWLGEAVDKGIDLRGLTSSILETLHYYLLKKYAIVSDNFNYEQEIENLGIEELKQLISLFSRASQELKTAIIPQLPLELAIVEWCERGDNEAEPSTFQPATSTTASQGNTSDGDPQGLLRGGGIGEQDLKEKWQALLAAVKPYNHSVAGLLHSCKPGSFDGKTLELEVFYKFHYDKLSEPKIGQLLERVAGEVFGRNVKIFTKLKEKEKV